MDGRGGGLRWAFHVSKDQLRLWIFADSYANFSLALFCFLWHGFMNSFTLHFWSHRSDEKQSETRATTAPSVAPTHHRSRNQWVSYKPVKAVLARLTWLTTVRMQNMRDAPSGRLGLETQLFERMWMKCCLHLLQFKGLDFIFSGLL